MTAAPLVIAAPQDIGRDLATASRWLASMAESAQRAMAQCGAILIRGLPLHSAADVAAVRDQLIPKTAEPAEFFAPREHHGGGVFSPMRWPHDRMLCPHHEQSYSMEFPGVVLLACLTAPAGGGETLLSDSRQVLESLPASLVRRFRAHGWLYVRTFRPKVGMSWQEAFRISDPAALELRCAAAQISLSWFPGGELRASRLRPAVVRHPTTGEHCWFTDAGFFSEWALQSDEREVLLAAFGPGGLPVNTYFGDGTALSPGDVRALETAYESAAVEVSWRAGDVLLVDNILLAHGRRPFHGPREIFVSMGHPLRLTDCVTYPPTVTPDPASAHRAAYAAGKR